MADTIKCPHCAANLKFEAGAQKLQCPFCGSVFGIDEIESKVVEYARQELSKLDYIELYMTPNAENHQAVISFNIKGVHPHDVASILDTDGVCVRSGNHCAQPLLRSMGIDSTCRASFYLYNTKDDVDKLVSSLNKAYNMFEKYLKK